MRDLPCPGRPARGLWILAMALMLAASAPQTNQAGAYDGYLRACGAGPVHAWRHRFSHRRRFWVQAPPPEPGERDSHGRLKRSTAAKAAFKRCNPCPSTGAARGRCPGYVIDHIVALKRGGLDDPTNMQWQTVEEAKAKDALE